DYDPFGGGAFAQGNYDQAIIVDPNNPNIIYVGGTQDGQPSGFIRIDITGLSDAHSFYMSNNRNDGGALPLSTTAPVPLKNCSPPPPPPLIGPNLNPLFPPFVNLIRQPGQPFLETTSIFVSNTARFANTGAGAKWIPYDIFDGTDYHRLIAIKDPISGQT